MTLEGWAELTYQVQDYRMCSLTIECVLLGDDTGGVGGADIPNSRLSGILELDVLRAARLDWPHVCSTGTPL